MSQPSTSPAPLRGGRAAMIYGLGTGIGLGLVECAIDLYTFHAMDSDLSQLGGLFSFLLWITVLLVSGALAGKYSGKISYGALVGLWVGMGSGVLLAISSFFLLISFSADYLPFAPYGLIPLYLSASIVLVVFIMSIGTGLGALGGLIGQNFFTPAIATVSPYRQSDPPQAEED